ARAEAPRHHRAHGHAPGRARQGTGRCHPLPRGGTGGAVLVAALRKELLLQWRTRAQFMAVFIFGASSLLLFSFAVGPNAEILRQFSAGFLWLGLLLSSTLTLAQRFHAEMENKA